MSEITSKGYKLKIQNDWFKEERDRYLSIDPQWNLDPSTPDGLKLASDAEIFGNLDELAQLAYNSKDPNRATTYDLDAICAITGTVRSQGTHSTVPLTLKGVAGTVIIAGKIVESETTGTQWTTDTHVTLDANGSGSTTATCVHRGAIQANTGTITRIVDTIAGWQSVTNDSAATSGLPRESDAKLRIKRALQVAKSGNNQIDNLIGALFDVDDVKHVRVFENYEKVDQPVTGLPPNSIAAVVDGGTDEDVALAIFRKKSPGCKLFATGTTVTVKDVFDKYSYNKKDITFARPVYVDMNVAVTIKTVGGLPNDIKQQIRQAILDYTVGDLTHAECGFNPFGFDIDEDISISRLYTPINKVIGRYGNSYVESLSINTVSSGQVSIKFNEISRWTDEKIMVTVNA